MHVTNSKWCDFVVWSPLDQPFVQRVRYNPEFMNKAIAKAQKIYFDKFLPAVLPYIILPSLVVNSPSACGSSMKKSLSSKATPLQRKTDSEKTSHSSDFTLAKQPVSNLYYLPSNLLYFPITSQAASKQLVAPAKQSVILSKQPVLPTKQPAKQLYYHLSNLCYLSSKLCYLPSNLCYLPSNLCYLPSNV